MPRPGAGGPETYVQTTAPLTPAIGDHWLDGSTDRVYTQTGWQPPSTGDTTLSNAVSVLSDKLSVLSQQVSVISNQVSVISQKVSVLSQAHSVLSQAMSVLSAGLGTVQLKVVSNAQVISGTTTTKISGLSCSVASAAVYQLDGNILFNMSVADTVLFNLSGTVSTAVAVKVVIGKDQSSQVVQNLQAFGTNASATISTTSLYMAKIDGVIVTEDAAGTVQLYTFASAAGNDINIKKGSYLRAFKIG
mgnify:FL=1